MNFREKIRTSVEIDRADFDEYGHLRFSNYPWYFNLARDEFIAHYGLGIVDMKKRNLGFFVRLGGPVKHIRQLKEEGRTDISTWFRSYERGPFMGIFQSMERGSECFATYITENVFVDLDIGKSVKPLKEIIKLIFG